MSDRTALLAAEAAVAAEEARASRRVERLRQERLDAKNAMVLSMGALVLTGYLMGHGRRGAGGLRAAHIVAGVALLGTAYWHQTLYQPGLAGRPR